MVIFNLWADALDHANQSQRQTFQRETFQCCLPDPLWLLEGLPLGEIFRRFETWLKKAHRKADTETSAVAERFWNTQHAIQWGETTILDQARRTKELKLQEALHILMTSLHQHLSRDDGLELLGCWSVTMKQMGGGPDSTSAWPHFWDMCISSCLILCHQFGAFFK